MLRNLEIGNFQSWKEAVFEFVEGINIITGSSDQGKTAVFRLLEWIRTNRPLGFAFRSDFAEDGESTFGAIDFYGDSDSYVLRERSDKRDFYQTVDDPELSALKGNVPEEVKELLNLDFYNVQSQHEKYFLLQDTPGEIGRKISSVVGLDIIREIQKKVDWIVDGANNEVADAELKERILIKQLEDYKYLPDLKVAVEKLEKVLKDRENMRNERSELTQIVSRLESLDREIEELELWLEVEPQVNELLILCREAENLFKEQTELQKTVDRVEIIDKEIAELDYEIEPEEEVKSFIEMIRQQKKDIAEKEELESIVVTVERLEDEIAVLENSIIDLKAEASDIAICPILGEHCEIIANR